jgi:hypothetical protein
LRPGTILLIRVNGTRSAPVKYLTQSTWSHAAFHAGRVAPFGGSAADRPDLI